MVRLRSIFASTRRSLVCGVSVVALALTLSLGVAAPARAACGANEQEVSIGFPGATFKNGSYCIPKNQGVFDIATNPIFIFLKGLLQVVLIGVGIGIAGGITYGGLLFMTARGNANQTQHGIEVIRDSILGLLAYIFMFTIINFLVPGGLIT